jgi:peptidylprolyl isomerase
MKRIALGFALLLALAASADAAPKEPKAVKLPPVAWRDADAENTMVIDTNQGRIFVELVPSLAPQSVARVKQLVRMHFYDGLTFFRVIDDFMAQTGDPSNNGQGGSVLPNVPDEFGIKIGPGGMTRVNRSSGQELGFIGAVPMVSQPSAMAALTMDGKVAAHPTFCSGVIGMAKTEDPNSGNSQFFLMRQPHTSLDAKYTAFGRVIVGEGIVRSIKAGEPVPPPQDQMTRVQMLADIPDGVRPSVKVVDTASPYFAGVVNNLRVSEGDDFSLCDLDVAGQAK